MIILIKCTKMLLAGDKQKNMSFAARIVNVHDQCHSFTVSIFHVNPYKQCYLKSCQFLLILCLIVILKICLLILPETPDFRLGPVCQPIRANQSQFKPHISLIPLAATCCSSLHASCSSQATVLTKEVYGVCWQSFQERFVS